MQAKKTGFPLTVKTMNGNLYVLEATPKTKILSLQGSLEQKTGVPIASQRLLYKALLLQPLKSLQQYGISSQSCVINLVANRIPSEASNRSHIGNSQIQHTNAVTHQNQQYKKHRFIQQRIHGFPIENVNDVIEGLRQSEKNILQLINCRNKCQEDDRTPFFFEKRQLEVGDWIDIREISGTWVEGQIIKKYSNFVQVHFNGLPQHWNQWIAQSSQRIMPFKSQTVCSEKSALLSPLPMNKPLIKNLKGTSKNSRKKILNQILGELPKILQTILELLRKVNNPQEIVNNKDEENEEFEQQQQNISFKNNRSNHSPPPSIQEEQYQYEMDLLEEGQDNVVMLDNHKIDLHRNKDSSSIKGGKSKNGQARSQWANDGKNRVMSYNRVVSNRKWGNVTNGGMRTTSIIRHMNHNVIKDESTQKQSFENNNNSQQEYQEYNPMKAESQADLPQGNWGPSFYSNKTKSQYEHEQHHSTYNEIQENCAAEKQQQYNKKNRMNKVNNMNKMKRQVIFDFTQGEEDDEEYQDDNKKRQCNWEILQEEQQSRLYEDDSSIKGIQGKQEIEEQIGQVNSKINEVSLQHKYSHHPLSEYSHSPCLKYRPSSDDQFLIHPIQNQGIPQQKIQQIKDTVKQKRQNISLSSSNLGIALSGLNTLNPPNLSQADNLSNQCEQNLSNKGQGEQEDDISAKSFGSKRSERLLDASSMKSLIIDTHHNDHNKSLEKKQYQRKNIFKTDQMEIQSVTSAKVHSKNVRFNSQSKHDPHYQEGILEEEDSINDYADETPQNNPDCPSINHYQENQTKQNQKVSTQKKQRKMKLDEEVKMAYTQLAPLCDRLGRLLIDISPHLAGRGFTQFAENAHYNQNLSTYTNQGSLQSRICNLSVRNTNNAQQGFGMQEDELVERLSINQSLNRQEEMIEKVSINRNLNRNKENSEKEGSSSGKMQNKSQSGSNGFNKYWNFQVPVMLTPWQMLRINRLLQEEAQRGGLRRREDNLSEEEQ